MQSIWQEMISRQFAAAIQMLRSAIEACPDTLWDNRFEGSPFWHLAYHALFFIDFYLSYADNRSRLCRGDGAMGKRPLKTELPVRTGLQCRTDIQFTGVGIITAFSKSFACPRGSRHRTATPMDRMQLSGFELLSI